MFEINLIKDRIIPAKQKNIIFGLLSLYLLAWVLSVATVVFLHVTNVRIVETYKRELNKLRKEIRTSYPGLPTSEEMGIMWNKLRPELIAANRLLNRQILWAPKLNRISTCLPEGMWIDEIRLEKDFSFGKTNKKGSTKDHQQVLIIEGRALSRPHQKGTKSIEKFVSGLKQDTLFMEGIKDVKPTSVKRITISAKSIIAFQILCRFNPKKGL